jgi:cytochrome c-type biogenesis protein CcmH
VLFWVLIALLTAAAVMAVLAPLGRAADPAGPADRAKQVYLDQLKELERDRAEGRISESEAEAARAEVARRLIATEKDAAQAMTGGGPFARRATAVAALVGIPVLSLTLYLGLGAPGLPGQPLAARLSEPAQADDIEILIARVEEHLAGSPEDGRGWEVIAPVYLRLGRAEDSADAFRNAIRLLGSSAARQTGLGEALVAASNGVVTADAQTAFEAARKADPAAPEPRFFLALAAEQEGDAKAAADGWRGLLADAPADAPWRAAVEQALARVKGTEQPGPTTAEVAAAAEMPADDQAAMIEGMVSGLAERLKQEPNDAEGWLRLIRSYAVLGRSDDAAEAARDALAGVSDAAGRERVAALMADLGIEQEAQPQ